MRETVDYNMKVVIVGDGKVGYTLTKSLSEEGHDLVVIDNNKRILLASQESLDVAVVDGNGASVEVQREAGVDTADLLIAATNGDETNLLCCMVAKKLGCKHTIARIRSADTLHARRAWPFHGNKSGKGRRA